MCVGPKLMHEDGRSSRSGGEKVSGSMMAWHLKEVVNSKFALNLRGGAP